MSAPWTQVDDYRFPEGWLHAGQHDAGSREYCRMLERGDILFFPEPPFHFAAEDREFLLSQQWAALRMHKNVSYRPADDVLRGVSGNSGRDGARSFHSPQLLEASRGVSLEIPLRPTVKSEYWILRAFARLKKTAEICRCTKETICSMWTLFPAGQPAGGEFYGCFTNLNPSRPRVWQVTGPFESLARELAESAGLRAIAEGDSFVSRTVQDWGAKLGIRGMGRTPYDVFMLKFHDYLKENSAFQAHASKVRIEFPPLTTWMVYTDGVAHAVMSGQYALEQTFLIPPDALVAPEVAPYRILENIAGRTLVH